MTSKLDDTTPNARGTQAETDPVELCVDRILDPDQHVAAAFLAILENNSNAPRIPGSRLGEVAAAELAALTGKRWRPGRPLRVRFLGGDPVVQRRLQPFAQQWTKYANIRLAFGSEPNAELRISFRQGGSWSYVGTDALVIAKNAPTMNFGWLSPTVGDAEYSRVVLHEFGHALGCIHEHQSPAARIPWDREAVYRSYGGYPNYWTRERVDRYVFAKYSATMTNFSAFDRSSIMLYAIPNELTVGNFEVPWNTTLSATDKSFIGSIYPVRSSGVRERQIEGMPAATGTAPHGDVG